MTKVISISDDVYEDLKKIKTNNSFSMLFRKLLEKETKKPLASFSGKWPGSKEELGTIKRELEKDRKNFKTRDNLFN